MTRTLTCPDEPAQGSAARLTSGSHEMGTSIPRGPSYWGEAWKAWGVACWAAACPARLEEAFGILTYHRVAPIPRGYGRAPLNVTPARLRQQLEGLLRRGYEPWPLQRALAYHTQRIVIPRRVFVVVFDDGYAALAHHALPVLVELGVPATVFLATAYLGQETPFPFDVWSHAGAAATRDAWRPMTTGEAEQMLNTGLIELGSHTHTHQDFRGRRDELQADVERSIEVLHRQFGVMRPTFALPFGLSEPHWPEALAAAGVSCCLTGNCQLVTPANDPYDWGRFGAEQYDTPRTLCAKLDGWFSYWQHVWHTARAALRPGRTSAALLSSSTARPPFAGRD